MTADANGPDDVTGSVPAPEAEPPQPRRGALRTVLVAAAVAVLLVVGVAAVRAGGRSVGESAGAAPGAPPAGSSNPEPAAPDQSPGATSPGSTDDPDKATSAPAASASDLPAVAPDPSATGGGSSGSRGGPDLPCPGEESPVHLPVTVTSADQVVAAFICAREMRTGADGSTVTYEVIRKVTGGLPKLIESYSVADKPTGDGPCPAIAYLVTPVRLQVGGTFVVVRPPLGTCAMPEVGATEALKLLGMSVVSEKRVTT